MFGTSTRIMMGLYVVGMFGFGIYSVADLASTSVFGALAYGAKWPVLLLHII